ncbi:MAG TPA: N-acetylmuramoyl-L-alanine amidase [Chloroflexaceae bacterium]|nr:N-acetylmuramoyl-L-alanine amidase [Chloroflexaceae bacterium]
MTPPIGLILTNASGPAAVRRAVLAADAKILKVVAGWGVDGGWTQAQRAEVAGIAPTLVVRTTWGDPSYAGGTRFFPFADRVLAELLPWLTLRPDAWVEVGNEPLLETIADELVCWRYRAHLDASITAIRGAFPRARIIAPAHMRNHPVRLGSETNGQARWDAICADVYARCDALGLHAYTEPQAVAGIAALHALKLGKPIWLTEFALNERLDDATRATRYRAVLGRLPVAAALLYHLVESPGGDPIHFNPNYTLTPGTLAALGAAPAAAPPAVTPALPDTVHYPEIRVPEFLLDVRQWRTVAAFRRHLDAHSYRHTAPWAKGVVIHHTYRPTGPQWRGAASIRALARFYRLEVEPGGWPSGPHLFIVGDAASPADNGIWQLTPLNLPGTHARAANSGYWGLEHVGDFTSAPMPAATAALGQGAAAALLDWAGLPTSPQTITPHSQWGKPACPGRGVDMDAYRRGVAAAREAR